MKKALLGMSVAAALLASGSVLAAEPVGTDYSSIGVHGVVSSGTCDIVVNNGQDLTLDPVDKEDFAADDTVIAAKPLSISFSNCEPTVTTGTIAFVKDGDDIDPVTGYLTNATSSGAKSVQIALQGTDGVTMDLNTAAGIPVAIDATTRDGSVALTAGYVTPNKSEVTAGVVDGYVRFSVDYL